MSTFVRLTLGAALAVLCASSGAPARAIEPFNEQFWTPVQISIWPPVQIPNDSCTVYGLSLGLLRVGIHEKVVHDALGDDAEDVIGFQGALYDSYSRNLYGVQLSGCFSSCSKNLIGAQASLIGNMADRIPCGVQCAGLANYVKRDVGFGIQLAGFCNEAASLTGVQAALAWNQCESGAGLQFSLANAAYKEYSGIQLGLFNWGEAKHGRIERNRETKDGHILSQGRATSSHDGVGDLRGLQFGLVSKAVDFYGAQCGLAWNDARDGAGLQFGFLNTADTMVGVQAGLLNWHTQSMTGLQVGLFNRATSMTGLQLGLFNQASTMTGIQIGLLNVIKENTALLIPLVNAHF